jgi:NAD(P)-dependent dehydrogenase (short-subunit alcohol dehydrogenase family)
MSEKAKQGLTGKIALVTGASRGAGRGIATELGLAGATVYVTGRSGRNGLITSQTKATRLLTVDETARIVTEAGGAGIPVYCDHTNDEEVQALYQQIETEQGKLDILVNNAWGGYEGYNDAPFDNPFWEQPMWRLDRMYTTGLRSHALSSRLGAQLMLKQKQGLIINTTTYMKPDIYDNGSPFYDVIKTAIARLSFVMAQELLPHNITALALAPGWMRTEDMLSGFNTDEEHFRETPLANTESPRYIGRAVVALATDKNVTKKAGNTLLVGSLASEYGFTDIDGTQPKFYGESSAE